MNSVVKCFQDSIDPRCTVSGDLVKGDCHVNVDISIGSSIAIDFDHCESPIDPNSTRCDFLYVADDNHASYLILMELTTNFDKSFDRILKQLRESAKYAQSRVPIGLSVVFCPALIATNLRKHTRSILKQQRKKISFHNMRRPVIWFLCGARLSEILSRVSD